MSSKENGSNGNKSYKQKLSDENISRNKKLFYKQDANVTLLFETGEKIKVSKTMLSMKSGYFYDVFYGPTTQAAPKNELKITDFDASSFKYFLDCLMGFKKCTDYDELLILPMAQKYQAEVLKPKEMSSNVCVFLNLALYYDCKELIDSVIELIKEVSSVYAVLDSEELISLLEPRSVSKLIEEIEMDIPLFNKIYDWSENYLKSRHKPIDIRSFFSEEKIAPKISFSCFESREAIFDFYDSKKAQNAFNSDTLLSFLKTRLLKDNIRLPSKSAWVSVSKGEVVEEDFVFKNGTSINMTLFDIPNYVELEVHRNKIIFEEETIDQNPLSCTINFVYNYSTSPPVRLRDYGEPYQNSSSACHDNSGSRSFIENDVISKENCSFYRFVFLGGKCVWLSLRSLRITYSFHVNCKILKTTFDKSHFSDLKESLLYFTSDIKYSNP